MPAIKFTGRYLLEKIIKHGAVLSSILAMLLLLAALTFLYRDFYQPMNDIASIYSLRGNANFSVIDEQAFLKIYNNIQDKLERPAASFDNLNSPF